MRRVPMLLTLRRLVYVFVMYPFPPSLARRATSPPKNTLNIPLRIDGNRRYVVGVNMSSGSNQQSFGFAVATSIGYTTVAGIDCRSCNGVTKYNQSASSSAKSSLGGVAGGPAAYQFFNSSLSGKAIKEDCALQQSNGSSWAYPNQTIIVANTSNEAFGSGTSGILGLGTNINAGAFSDTVFAGILSRNPTKKNFTFGMALNPPADASDDGGVLHWLTPDPSAYTGQLSWKTVVGLNSNSTSNSSIMSDWTVQMNGWSFSSGSNRASVTQDGPAIVDPYYPDIYLPQSQAHTIYAAVQGASSHLSSNTESWSIPCSSKFNFVVNINSMSVPMDQNDLIIKNGTACAGVIQGWTDPNVSQTILGGAFINKLYLIFVITPDGLNSIGFGSRAVGSPLSAGSIAAIILGSLIFFALLVTSSFLLYRRNVNRRSRPRSIPGNQDGLEPLINSSNASRHAASDHGSGHASMPDEESTSFDYSPTQYVMDYSTPRPAASTVDQSHSPMSHDRRSDHLPSGDIPLSTISVERNPAYASSRHTASTAAFDLVHSPPIVASSQNFAIDPYVVTPGGSRPNVPTLSASTEKRRLRQRLMSPQVPNVSSSSSHLSTETVVDDQSDYYQSPPEYEP